MVTESYEHHAYANIFLDNLVNNLYSSVQTYHAYLILYENYCF